MKKIIRIEVSPENLFVTRDADADVKDWLTGTIRKQFEVNRMTKGSAFLLDVQIISFLKIRCA